jgi:LMBR1 domain-containing protein 1
MMSTRDLAQKMSSTNSGNSEICVIQKFVKSKGPNAFITRAHYRKNKPPQCYVITNRTSFFDTNPALEEHEKFMTNIKKPLSCSIVHSKGGKVSEEGVS